MQAFIRKNKAAISTLLNKSLGIKKLEKVQYFGILLVVILGCEGDKCFYGAGNLNTQVLSVDSFQTIQVSGIFDIELVQDSVYKVECQAGVNVIEHIEAEIKSDTLNLYNYNSCFWMRDYKKPLLRIHFRDIRHIDVYESSYLFSVDSITDSFSVYFRCGLGETNLILNNQSFTLMPYNTTGGKYIFRGKTQQLNLYIPYTSLVDASLLQANKVNIEHKSVSDARVCAVEQLVVKILNRGNVYYKGNPEITIDSLASSGQLIDSN